MNEEGTETVAATSVVMKLSAAPIEEPIRVFRADHHPFHFLIQDDDTGLVLFRGRAEHPATL